MGRDHHELPANGEGRPLGSWGRIDLILRLPATAGRKMLLVVIAKMESRRDAECWASMKTLAREASLSRGYVWEQIGQMEGEGMITVAGRHQGCRTMRVQVCWEVIERMAGEAQTCHQSLQVQPDDLDPFGPDEQTCQDSLQVEADADESCHVSLQDEEGDPATCQPALQVEAEEGAAASTCQLLPRNLSTGNSQLVNSEAPTCHVTLPKGFNQGLKGSREGGSRGALTNSAAPSPSHEEPEPLLPNSTISAGERAARERLVEELRPAWLKKVASGGAR